MTRTAAAASLLTSLLIVSLPASSSAQGPAAPADVAAPPADATRTPPDVLSSRTLPT